MLKRIAIVTGLVALFGAQPALATPTLDLGGVRPMQGAGEAHAALQDRGAARFSDAGTRVQSPNAPFTWNP